MPWFPQREAKKGERRKHQPRARAALHQAVDESFVCCQDLRCAKEGLCTMEDAQLAISLGRQLKNVVFLGKIMADNEAQKLE